MLQVRVKFITGSQGQVWLSHSSQSRHLLVLQGRLIALHVCDLIVLQSLRVCNGVLGALTIATQHSPHKQSKMVYGASQKGSTHEPKRDEST